MGGEGGEGWPGVEDPVVGPEERLDKMKEEGLARDGAYSGGGAEHEGGEPTGPGRQRYGREARG